MSTNQTETSLGASDSDLLEPTYFLSRQRVHQLIDNPSTTAKMPKATVKRSTRSHRLGGCENCRKRHTKCDQVRPKCLTCQAIGLDCQGYNPTVQWVTDDVQKNIAAVAKSGTRQHLYCETVRLSMTAQLLGQVQPNSLDDFLAEIDQWTNSNSDLNPSQADGKSIGPFAVMDLSVGAAPTLPSVGISDEVSDNGGLPSDTPSVSGVSGSLPGYLQWSDLFDLDFEQWLSQQPDDFGLNSSTDLSQASLPTLPLDLSTTSNEFEAIIRTDAIDDEDVKKEAPFLIKHFLDSVIDAVAALPFNTTSPLKILHVSAAVQTHADLTYLGRSVKHANIANLYAILACSAYHLGSNPSSPQLQNSIHWMDLASRAGANAKTHLHKSLRSELFGEEKAKYKDQLMALMSTLIYSIMAGHKADVRCYMIESERLLRLRGLAKKHISRRARLLHHMYTWIRIVGESTYVLHDYKHIATQSRIIAPEVHPGHNDKLDDFLRVDQRSVTDDSDMEAPKTPEIGRHDIHLEDLRNDPDSMYLRIYGLSEQWLSLLSQTARLANYSEICQDDSGLQRSLAKKSARLENMICSFATDKTLWSTSTIVTPTESMVRALNSALIIYFYRRIRNVNPLILQSHVDDVITALKLFDLSLADHSIQGPGTAFPAFIAGCEACPGPRRDALLSWVETAFWKTGFKYYMTAKEVMQEVWLNRDESTASLKSTRHERTRKLSSTSTWIEVSMQKQEWVIVC